MSKLAAATTLFLVAALPAADAQQTTFNPSVSFGFAYTDNVDYLDQAGATTGDTGATFGAVLPLVRKINQGSLRLTYDVGTIAYQDESQFDTTNHLASFDFYRESRREATWRVSTRYAKTDQQRTSPILPTEILPNQTDGLDDANLSLTNRTDRETIDAAVDYGWRIGRRWGLTAGFNAGQSTLAGGTDVEDRTWYGTSFGVRNTVSAKSSVGMGYSFRRVELDTSGTEDFQTLDFFFDRDLGRKLKLELLVGGLSRSPDGSESDTQVFGSASFSFNEGLTLGPVRLGFSAGVSPGKAEGLTGTAMNSTAGFSISGVRTDPMNWRIGTFYNHRDPFESGEPSTDTLRVGVGAERRISRLFGLRFGADYSDQTSDDPILEVNYTRAELNLVVYPLGGTRIAGRSARTP